MDNTSLVNEIATCVAIHMKSWKSIHLNVREDILPDLEHGLTGFELQDYIETSAGQRVLKEVVRQSNGKVVRLEAYCDGAKCANVQFDGVATGRSDGPVVMRRVNVSRAFQQESKFGRSDRPTPLVFFYVGKDPLYEAILRARFLRVVDTQGRRCARFLFPNLKWGARPLSVVYDIDIERGLPLKVSAYRDEPSIDTSKFVWSWESSRVDVVDGIPISVSSRTIYTKKDSELIKCECQSDVQYSKFDETFPASTFWPVYAPGVLVVDSVAKKVYKIPREVETKVEVARKIHAPSEIGAFLLFSSVVLVLFVGARILRQTFRSNRPTS